MGLFWGLLAAVSYASLNLALRAVPDVDPLVSALLRGAVMTPAAWAIFLIGWFRARDRSAGAAAAHGHGRGSGRSWLHWTILGPLLVVGVVQWVIGNGSFQVALAQGGLTVAVPAMSAASLWGTALGAWWLVGERLTGRAAGGLLLLVVALPLLTSSGGGGSGSAWLGAAAGVLAGLCYGSGNVVMRRASQAHATSHGATIAPVTGAGLAGLIAVVLIGQGPSAVLDLDAATLGWLLVAGLFNTVAFIAQTRALTLLPASRVGALSALQTGLSVIGGVLVFVEPLTGLVAAGLMLSVAGATLAQHRRPRPPRPVGAPARLPG